MKKIARRKWLIALGLAVVAAFLLASGAPSGFAETDDHNPIGVSGAFEGIITTGCAYNVVSHNARRGPLEDIVVPGAIGKYGLKMIRYYNSRRTISYGLMGPGWSYEYLWISSNDKVEYANGDVWDSHCTGAWGLGGPLGVSDWSTTWNGYPAFRLADGGTVVFENQNWGVATKIIDPYGQITTITLNSNSGLITRVTEPGGRYLQFTYNGTLLTRVDAYDGQGHQIDWVVYHYTAIRPAGGGTQGTPMNCLTSVDYSDGTHAYYTYEDDNVPDDPQHGSSKIFPLVSICNDVRYHGPMRRVAYDYQNQGPHGAILKERYSPSDGVKGVMVSSIDPAAPSPIAPDPDFETTYTETRGDSPTRTFTYTTLHLHRSFSEPDPCPTWRPALDPAPQQFLLSYTDFQNHITRLGYDANWYVNSVTDANNHTTSYTRGPPPPNGIGEITQIQHPGDNSTINYTYTDRGHYLIQITNERGAITYHTRDANHRITRTDYKDANGNILTFETFTYNNFGQTLTHRMNNGAYESFAYNGRGLLTDKWNPKFNAVPSGNDPHTHYDYYTSGPWTDRVMTMILPANVSGNIASETYEYDRNASGGAVAGRGLVTKITHADSRYQSFSYDAYGNKLWEENELRQRTSYTYDNYNRVLTATRIMSPAPNETTIYTYAPTNGTGTSPYLHTTNNPDSVTTPTGIITKNDYDQNFRKTSSTAAFGTSSAATTWFHYDPIGNQDYVTNPRGSGPGDAAYTTYTDYDSRNRKWRVREPLGRITEFHYDDYINVTRIIRPDQTTETKTYDGLNRMLTDTVPQTSTINLTTWFTYNPSGTLYKIIDPNGQPTWFTYNASDEKITMIYSDHTQFQSWTYDDAHNLASRTTVNGDTQSFTYDNRNQKVTMRWGNNADWANFTYDDVGRLLIVINANSTVSRAYDAAGRLYWDRQNITGLGIRDVRYEFNADGSQTRLYVVSTSYDYRFTYDAMGRFEKIFAPGLTNPVWQYTYDPASNETARLNLYDGVAQTYTPRDALNRMTRRDIKKGATTISYEAYTYDAMSRLRSVAREDGKTDSFTYYLNGELNAAQYGATTSPTPTPTPAPTPTPTPTPTPSSQVATPRLNPSGGSTCSHSLSVTISTTTTAAQIRYTTDGSTPTSTHGTLIAGSSGTVTLSLGHVFLQAMAFKSGMTNSAVQSGDYAYDCGQLPPPAPEAPDTIRTVGYYLDKAGNRTSVTDTVYGNTSYTPNNFNQYTGVTGSTITNGPEHEISAYQNVSYTYINDEHLTTASDGTNTYDLKYDALGRCVKRTLNGVTTYYIYDGEKPILEYDAAGTQVGWNVYGKGIDEILQRIALGTAYFFQQDHEGSVTHLTNVGGNVIEKYRYDAFGAPTTIYSAGTYNNRFKFTGREYNPTFGFYEYRVRAYHPGLGRFMSEDPKLFHAGDYNLLRYCHNDPIDNTDPMGLDDQIWARTQERMEAWSEAKNKGYAVWAMAKWADSSNNFQGTFTQFSAGQGLTMGQVRSINGHEVRRATPVHNIVVFHRSSDSIVIFLRDGMILQYPAANRTVNPKGDPTRVDSNGPAPNGTFPIQSPVLDPSPAISYGPVFYPIGAVGPNGERQDIARQRGIGLHGGRDSYLYPTHGCIRMNNGDISNLYNQTQHAPLQTITIGD